MKKISKVHDDSHFFKMASDDTNPFLEDLDFHGDVQTPELQLKRRATMAP